MICQLGNPCSAGGKLVLGIPKRGGKRNNLSSIVKKRIACFSASDEFGFEEMTGSKPRKSGSSLADAVAAKLEDGNIRAAVRILRSDETPSVFSSDSLFKLQSKHPSKYVDRKPVPDPLVAPVLFVDESDVHKALRSFPAGSSGGVDGLRPQHFVDLVANVESGASLLTALTAFVNIILAGKCHPDIVPVFFGGRLLALDKKCGGIRPIVVGSTLRRLSAKCAASYSSAKLVSFLGPRQLGVGIAGGCEAAVHAARRFLNSSSSSDILVKLDFSNAFNTLRRDAMLSAVFETIHELYHFCHLAYSNSSFLKFGPHTILSEEGPQQGDPLGPLLFCITVQPMLSSLESNLAIGFLDDFTVGGSITSVSKDIDLISVESARLGLHLNVEKCELISQECHTDLPQSLLDFSYVALSNATLLGAPLFKGKALDDAWDSCCSSLSLAIDRLSTVSAHDALILLRASFSSPKVTYLMRCAPCVDHPAFAVFDNLLKLGICRITNSDLSDAQWLQASLPVRDGGLGVRRVSSLATCAF